MRNEQWNTLKYLVFLRFLSVNEQRYILSQYPLRTRLIGTVKVKCHVVLTISDVYVSSVCSVVYESVIHNMRLYYKICVWLFIYNKQ